MYEILLSGQAERDLKRLSGDLFHRVVADIESLSATPRPPGSRKLTGSGRVYRLRVSDYRILYEIEDRARIVRIMRVRHRREAYR